jgi:WD40 repeat protein
MGAGASASKTAVKQSTDFSRLAAGRDRKGIRISEPYDSDVDEEYEHDEVHLRRNKTSRFDFPHDREDQTEGGRERVVAVFEQLHPHTKTGKHLLAENGRQWGDAEPQIPDMALDFIYGYHSNESLRQTMAYTSTGDITYIAGGTVVTYIHAGAADDDDGVAGDEPHRQCAYFGENISCNNDFTCLAMHTDGNTAAVGEYGPRAAVYVFNVYTMEILAKLTSIPQEGVGAVSFSADGKLLATVATDACGTLSVFEWESQTLVAREKSMKLSSGGVKTKVFAMKFNTLPEYNNRIWTCATQDTRVWDVDPDDAELVGAPCHYGEKDLVQTSLCITFDPKGDAITGTKSGDLQFFRGTRLWKIERGRHRGPINCVHSESRPRDVGGPVFFSAGKDGVIQEWALKLETLQYVNEVEWKIGRRFVPGAAPGALEGPWNIRSLAPYCKEGVVGFGTKDGGMHEFRFGDTNGGDGKSEEGNAAKANETAEDVLEDTFVTLLEPLYSARPNLEKYPCASKAEGGVAIAIHPKRYTLVTADFDNLRLWNMPTRDMIRVVKVSGGGSVASLDFSPEGDQLAVGLDNGLVMVYSTETWKCDMGLDMSPEEYKEQLEAWEVEAHSVRKDRRGRVTCVKYCPKGHLLAAGSSEGIIDVYDTDHQLNCVNSCQPSKKMGAGRYSQGHGTPIVHIDWDVDGTRMRTVCENMEQLYWEVGLFRGGSGQAVNAPGVADVEWDTWTFPLGWHTTGVLGQVEAVADIIASARSRTTGAWIAVGEYRGGITIFPFPCRDGEEYEVAELQHSTARLTDVLISADDEFMVTSSVDGVFQWRVVDADDDEEVNPTAIHTRART